MREALALAERGRGHTAPNPVVGALVVAPGAGASQVVGRGYHRRAGGPHAEIFALDEAKERARGGTLYVTLEPCCHVGRTGPCTEAVIASGVRRVVVGCRDENPKVAGKGIRRLRRAGLQVEVGCLEEECRRQNRAFFRWISEGRPAVTLKAASTLDGFIAPRHPGAARTVHWITSPPARAMAHELRAEHDAILVGAGTVRADDPLLTVRRPGKALGRPPLRVVLDGRLKMPPDARLLRERPPGSNGKGNGAPGVGHPLVIGARAARASASQVRQLEARQRALVRAGAEVVLLPGDAQGRVPLPALLQHLGARGVQSLLLEGGATVYAAFIAAGLVDSVALFLAPRLQGGGVPLVGGEPPGRPWEAPLLLGPFAVEHFAGDILLRADVAPLSASPRRR
jgi:diaminohydroxyphosphoribosylaminopyrimidine deaminase/5-amino-6-(5-phosphoribosylamino)uracil reductase